MNRIQENKPIIKYVIYNIFSKGLAALAQLYAIYIFTRMHTKDEAAIIFILLGYAIWFQLFELGISQVLQNKFNTKLISLRGMIAVALAHLLFMWALAIFILNSNFSTELLLPIKMDGIEGRATSVAFSMGASILIVASNNLITQRILLVLNRGQMASTITIIQSLLAVLGLASYELIDKADLTIAVVLYLGPQVIVHIPLLASLMMKLVRRAPRIKKYDNSVAFVKDCLAYWAAGLLSTIYLGLDYYFAAHYLTSEQVVSYHLATRLFFISYIVYYSFVLHRARRLSYLAFVGKTNIVNTIFKDSIFIGLVAVLVVYCLGNLLEFFGAFDLITNGVGINYLTLFCSFIYFMVRVFRDVALVIAGGIGEKKVLYKFYSLELIVGLSIMPLIVSEYNVVGIFMSMTLACTAGLIGLFAGLKN